MHYYLTRGDENNIEKSILCPINNYIGMENIDENIYGWAISRGAGKNKSKNERYSKEMMNGDNIIIWPKGKSEKIYSGTIIKTVVGIDIPKKIWGEKTDSKYDCTIFIKNIKEIIIEKEDLIDRLGYKGAPQGIGELKGKKVDAIKSIINNKNINLKRDDIDKEKNLLVEKNIVDKYWGENRGKKIKYTWNTDFKNNRINRSNKKLMKSNKLPGTKKLNNRSKKIIGITGEYIANQFINNNIRDILEKLGIIIEDINNITIKWFNESMKIENIEKEIDESIGKGYDIEVRVVDNIVKFEVKSCYEGNINEIVLTRNELVEMKQNSSNNNEFYYLLLVSDIKNNPKIKIVKNFSNEFSNEYLSISSRHSLYINNINSKYIV